MIFFLFNNGNYLRDFTHVDDVAEILYKFLAIGKIKKKIFNICSSKQVKIKDLLLPQNSLGLSIFFICILDVKNTI